MLTLVLGDPRERFVLDLDDVTKLVAELRSEANCQPGEPEWFAAIALSEALDSALEIEFSGPETSEIVDAIARLHWRGQAGDALLKLRSGVLRELERARAHLYYR